MKILLIEDDKEKCKIISNVIRTSISHESFDIVGAESLTSARREILKNKFDLIIFDLYLPNSDSDTNDPLDISEVLIEEFRHGSSYNSEAIAITKYDLTDVDVIRRFNDVGITIVQYSISDSNWKDCLIEKISRANSKPIRDFIIFCALKKEREALNETTIKLGKLINHSGLNCQEVLVGTKKGICIVPAKPGLVNMAIAASKSIELFQPKIVAMCGICAGVPGESNYLDLVIGDSCWEWQTGKYKEEGFKQEAYQSVIDSDVKVELEQLLEDPELIKYLKSGLYDGELKSSKVLVAPISSGSAVIADEAKLNEIGIQHRKMAALEMEMYSMYEAARQSLCKPIFFGVKGVVDLGDASKGDNYHHVASILSARFVVSYLERKLG